MIVVHLIVAHLIVVLRIVAHLIVVLLIVVHLSVVVLFALLAIPPRPNPLSGVEANFCASKVAPVLASIALDTGDTAMFSAGDAWVLFLDHFS
jgi:hypothetical protein